MDFMHVLNKFCLRTEYFVCVPNIIRVQNPFLHLNEDTYTTILHVYKRCAPIKNVLYIKFVYAYQIFYMSIKCCVLIQWSVVICVYHILLTY